MSKRHRGDDLAPLSKAELRAHAHAERHRIKGELHAIAARVGRSCDLDECDEPAVGWKPVHHRDDHHARERTIHHGRLRHWKLKEWKRRSTERRQRALQVQRHAQSS
ncbi:MAG: hypothetical protein ACO3KZ_01255 [Ilumatobacteraceae bacterium]|jgi:hypothetical protein